MTETMPTDTARCLLCISHAPSPRLKQLQDAACGQIQAQAPGIVLACLSPGEVTPACVQAAHAVLLAMPENLASMSGLMKDFFDRCYEPARQERPAMPVAAYIRAGHDGTGTQRQLETFITGLRWRWVQAPVVLRGPWRDVFIEDVETLAATVAVGLEAGIY